MEKWEFKLIKERREKEYFISPEGKIYKWKGSLKKLNEYASTHYLLAENLCKKEIDDKVTYLYNIGWILVGSVSRVYMIRNAPTQAQLNTLYDLGVSGIVDDNGITYTIRTKK